MLFEEALMIAFWGEYRMLEDIGKAAKYASRALAKLNSTQKKELLLCISDTLEKNISFVLEANAKDMAQAEKNGISKALQDRLFLNEDRLKGIIADVRHVAGLEDPIGQIIGGDTLDNGLTLTRLRVPLGVIGIIYEARPNVTVDIASLCLKTGNAAILRGGKETLSSNMALLSLIHQALVQCGLPKETIQYIENPDRALISDLLRLDTYVDMIIPRGGQSLQTFCKENATIPVILGGIGVCHIFVDETADMDAAQKIIENAKVQRPSVCNALETLLVHSNIAETFLPKMAKHLSSLGVTFHACSISLPLLEAAGAKVCSVQEEDLCKEWLSLDLNVCVVASFESAIEHIQTYSSGHSEAILTGSFAHAESFVAEVDAAAVYVNASTRFTDGGEFGLGAEVAVSTQKLHARGPMGLEALTTYKWVGYGNNLVRE